MIEQLLTLSRLDAGAGDAERSRCDVDAIVAAVVADDSFEAEARCVSVTLAGKAPSDLDGSPAFLVSAIENVVRNAVRHTAEGTAVSVRVGGEGEPAPRTRRAAGSRWW